MKEVYSLCRQSQVVMIGAILIIAILSAVPVLAKARITSTIDAQPTTKLTAEESRSVSVAAGRILKHVNEARVAIEEKKKKAALEDVENGLTLVKIIEQAVPPIKVKADIQSGDLKYHHEEESSQSLIPIFEELDQVDVMGPARGVEKEKSPSSGKKHTGSSAITYEGIEFTSLDLNLPLAKRNLGYAKKALNDNKLEDADSALQTIQTRGVLFELVEDYLPLREAADNLKLAEYEFKNGQAKEAETALKVASDALKDYAKIAGENRAKEVKKLHKEIDDLSGKLEHQKDQEAVVKKMASWWDRVAKWLKS